MQLPLLLLALSCCCSCCWGRFEPAAPVPELGEGGTCETRYEDWLATHIEPVNPNHQPLPVIGPSVLGRGLFATRNVSAGSNVFLVPSAVLLRSTDAAQDPRLATALKSLRTHTTKTEIYALMLCLCLQKTDPHSLWAPYFDVLPSFADWLDAWTTPELAELQNEDLSYEAKELPGQQREAYQQALDALGLTQDELRIDTFVWAWRVAFSRAHRFGDKGLFIVPHMDMANHDFWSNAEVIDEEGRGVWLRAKKDIPAGTEITLNYGFKSNAELLLGYGFGVPDNPSEYVSVRLRQIPSGDKLLEQKNAIIERLALRKARITPHLPPEGLLAWFRFVACDDASRLDAATLDEDGSLIFDKVSVQNEIWALHLCATEAKLQVSALPTTGGDDVRIAKLAFAYRVERKRILTEAHLFCVRAATLVNQTQELIPYQGEIVQRRSVVPAKSAA